MEHIQDSCVCERAIPDQQDPWTLLGVKLLSRHSQNGREYPPAVQKGALAMFDGQRIYIDHPDAKDSHRPLDSKRSYTERIGVVKKGSARYDEAGECLRGDIKLNAKHPNAEMVRQDFDDETPGVGISYMGKARFASANMTGVCEQIVKVFSLDIVDSPATVQSLRESADSGMEYERGKEHGEMLTRLEEHEKKLAEHATLHEQHGAHLGRHEEMHAEHRKGHEEHDGRIKMLEDSLTEAEKEFEREPAKREEELKAVEQLREKLKNVNEAQANLTKLVSEAAALEKRIPRTPPVQPNPMETRMAYTPPINGASAPLKPAFHP